MRFRSWGLPIELCGAVVVAFVPPGSARAWQSNESDQIRCAVPIPELLWPGRLARGNSYFGIALERPTGCVAQSGGAGKSCGAVEISYDETVLGMGVSAGELVVMAAQGAGDLEQGDVALGLILALPEQGEALSADGTVSFRSLVTALAQNLHVSDLPVVSQRR